MAVRIGSASIDERGKASGGKAGDQTGKEVKSQNWYRHPKEWVVFRALDPDIRDAIAEAMEAAVRNNHIGYDQGQRTSLYTQVKTKGFDPAAATADCETDCSALVRVCICYATAKVLGKVIDPGNFRTATESVYLMRTGLFEKLTDADHCATSVRLARGDILCTKTSGHTVVVLTDGSKCDASKAHIKTATKVRITGASVYVRSAPDKTADSLGVVHKGEELEWQRETSADGWHLVVYKGQNGWVSGKYSEVV